MTNHKTRIAQLEKRSAPARKVIVAYADQTPADEMQRLEAQARNDSNFILFVVEYKDSPIKNEVAA